MLIRSLSRCSVVLLAVLAGGGPGLTTVQAEETAERVAAQVPTTSQVLRLVVPELVAGQHTAEVVLYHRDGAFHHGYAVAPRRDNLVHRVDVTPSSPVRFVEADGTEIEVPAEARGKYSYKNDYFLQSRSRYQDGDIDIVSPAPVTALQWDGDRVHGVVDVLFLAADEPNTSGRNPWSLVYRLEVDGNLAADGTLSGGVVAWSYAAGDDDYGADSPRLERVLAGGVATDHWQPSAANEIRPGHDWPQVRGPDLTGSAPAPAEPLIGNLHDARLVWVGEELIGGGRSGGLTRGEFAMFPISWTSIGYGGFAGPTVVGNNVYLHLMRPDEAVLRQVEGIERNPYVRLGADIRALANNHNAYRDEVWCVDARTGQTKWRFLSARTFGNQPTSKSGRGTTVCALNGRLYAVGAGGLYCLDGETGDLIWKRGGDDGVGYGSGGARSSRDMSAVAIAGVIVLSRDGKMIGIDPETGDQIWQVANAAGRGATPVKAIVDGRELVVGVSTREVPRERDRARGAVDVPEDLVVIDPATGAEVMRSPALGSNSETPLVWGDIVVANGERELTGKKQAERWRAAGARLSADSAETIWRNAAVAYPSNRVVPVVHDGVAYIDSRSGFAAVDMATGETLGRLPHIYSMTGGSHNWTWHIATGDRILTSFGAMLSTADGGFKPLPGRLALDHASGYGCPIKPAIADGRIFMRLADRLVCYDLREPAEQVTDVATLTAVGAMAGVASDRADITVRVRRRDGEPLDVTAQWPRVLHGSRTGLPNWLWEYRHVQYRRSLADGLTWTDNAVSGQSIVRVAYNNEPWDIQLTRTGSQLSGTYTRHANALAEPLAVSGTVTGQLLAEEADVAADQRVVKLSLPNGIANSNGLMEGSASETLELAITVDATGTMVRGLGWCGRVNTQPWAVDASQLQLSEDGLSGAVTVLVMDDQYFDYDYQTAASEQRRAGAGGTIAVTIEISATLSDGAFNGTFTGAIGVPWSISGELTGEITAADPLVP